MSLVSVLMAAFDAQDTIVAAVESLCAQSHPDWELIIASDDGVDYLALCQAQLAAISKNSAKIRQVHTERRASGPSIARNTALKAAQGDYVAALDADDLWLPKRLEELLTLAQEHGVVCDNVAAALEDQTVLRRAFEKEKLAGFTGLDMADQAVEIMACGLPLHPLARRDLVEPGWREDLRFAEDVIFNLEVLSRSGNYVLAAESLCLYVTRPQSICNKDGSWRLAEEAYGHILTALQGGHYDLAPPIRRVALKAIEDKRAVNKAYGEAVLSGQCRTFQEFLALQKI